MVHLSYGFLVFYKDEKELVYHIIQRRDSHEYISFLTGKTTNVRRSFTNMTIPERNRIWEQVEKYIDKHDIKQENVEHVFDILFQDLYIDKINKKFYERGRGKFIDFISSGEFWKVFSETESKIERLEWGIPKGLRNNTKEPPMVCALREYKEETGNKSYLYILDVEPVIISFKGTDGGTYRACYFLARSRFKSDAKNEKYSNLRGQCISEETNDIAWADITQAKKLLSAHYYQVVEKFDKVINSNESSVDSKQSIEDRYIKLVDGSKKWEYHDIISLANNQPQPKQTPIDADPAKY